MHKVVKHKKILFAVLGVLSITVLLVIFFRPKADTDEDILWREYPVTEGTITASLDGGGTLEATGIQHSFDVDLKIQQILVEAGDEVKAGDLLAKYDLEDLEKRIGELKDSLRAAQRALEDARNNKSKAQLQEGLAANEADQSSQSAYERQKREIENAIRILEEKIQQFQIRLPELYQELWAAQTSEDGSVDSHELEQLKAELRKLQKELDRLERNNSASGDQGQIDAFERQRSQLHRQLDDVNAEIGNIQSDSSPENIARLEELERERTDLRAQIADLNDQISDLEDAAAAAVAMQKKQDQIAEMQQLINRISAKEERIASLTEQIRQAESDLQSTLFDLETQQIALETLNNDHEKQTTQNKENQQTQGKIEALTKASLDNAIENAQAEVERIQNEIAAAEAATNTPALTAKAGGVVTEVNFREGDQVPGGKSIVTIGDSGEKLVVVQVPQEDIADIEVGQAVEMQFLADPDHTLKGQVHEKSLVPTPGADSVVYQVKIAFDEPQPELLEGMTCSVKFVLKQVADVLTLSNKAIQLKDGKQFVTLLLPDGSHQEREIQTGFSDGRISEITDGLAEGDVVVVAG